MIQYIGTSFLLERNSASPERVPREISSMESFVPSVCGKKGNASEREKMSLSYVPSIKSHHERIVGVCHTAWSISIFHVASKRISDAVDDTHSFECAYMRMLSWKVRDASVKRRILSIAVSKYSTTISCHAIGSSIWRISHSCR